MIFIKRKIGIETVHDDKNLMCACISACFFVPYARPLFSADLKPNILYAASLHHKGGNCWHNLVDNVGQQNCESNIVHDII